MADLPILFSAAMVRALLDGRKTQTRRILKPQPLFGYTPDVTASEGIRFRKGDRLWVRETFSGPHDYDTEKWPPRAWFKGDAIYYWADGNPPHGDWTRPKPGIHMPRWASRLEEDLARYRAEDSDKDRQMAALRGDHSQALVREEEKGYAKGVRDSRRQFVETLRNHWLWQIECHHEDKTDTPRCACSLWACEPQPSVGQAVERWIEHVIEQLDAVR